jgi:hypothetical protein
MSAELCKVQLDSVGNLERITASSYIPQLGYGQAMLTTMLIFLGAFSL